MICTALEQVSFDDELDTALEDQLRRMFSIDAECPLDINSLQQSLVPFSL